jgi:three-Cys-motif partner protein
MPLEASGGNNPIDQRTEDPCPTLPIERGPDNTGVGRWVPAEKHRLLYHYLYATRNAWKKWSNRIFIDPFAGPGRIQVSGESFTRDGGAVVAWRALAQSAPFTQMRVGDIDPERAQACEKRLRAAGASVQSYAGPAVKTVKNMVLAVPPRSLCMAYVDPYNLELLAFSIIQELAKLQKVDLAINFSTMDLQRNADMELKRARFDGVAPGWRQDSGTLGASKQNIALEFFRYWRHLVLGLGFEDSQEMPLVCNDQGSPIYRIVFFTRHKLPKRIWGDVARGHSQTLELFPESR